MSVPEYIKCFNTLFKKTNNKITKANKDEYYYYLYNNKCGKKIN